MEQEGGGVEAAEDSAGSKKGLHLELSEEFMASKRFLTSKFKKGKKKAEPRTPEEIERWHLEAIQDYADGEDAVQRGDRQARMAYKAFSIPFLLPSGSQSGSTTVVSIAIRYSKRYQVVLEYHDEKHMRQNVWGPWANVEVRSEIVDEVRFSMGWSGEPNTDFEEKARQFLRDCLDEEKTSLEPIMPELASVLGKKVAISGGGRNRLVDRCLIRRIVHVAQGIEDESLGDEQVLEEGDGGRAGGGASEPRSASKIFEVFCSFDHKEQLRVGKILFSGLKRITVWAPCGMAPGQDGEWVDTAGCNDLGPRQIAVLKEEVEGAEQLAAVVESNLSTTTGTSQHLRESAGAARIARVAAGGKIRTDNTMMVIHNRELINLSAPILDQEDFEKDAKNVAECKRKTRAQLLDDILKENLQVLDGEEATARNKAVLDLIPMLHPTVSLFTSLAFADEAHVESEDAESEDARKERLETRQDLLDSTGGYELLGTLELFLKAGSRAGVEKLLRTLEGPDGLCNALWQVKKNQRSVATGVGASKKLAAAARSVCSFDHKLDSMAESFEASLQTIASTFFHDETMALVQREFDRTCVAIEQRADEAKRVVYTVDTYFKNLKSKLRSSLKSRVEALQQSLLFVQAAGDVGSEGAVPSDFRREVEAVIESFLVGHVASLKLSGDNTARIEDIKKMATDAVRACLDKDTPGGLGKVVGKQFQKRLEVVFSELYDVFQIQLNAIDEDSREEFLSKVNFTVQLPLFAQAAGDVVDDVQKSLVNPFTVKFLRDLVKGAEALLFEDRASWSPRDQERLQDLTSLSATLGKVVRMWEKTTATQQIGKDLFEDFRSSRLMDTYKDLARFPSRGTAPLLDETPSKANFGKHNTHKGYLPLVGTKVKEPSEEVIDIWKQATRTDRSELGNLFHLNEALQNNTKGTLEFVEPGRDELEREPDQASADDFLVSYLIVARNYGPAEARVPATLKLLRERIFCEAARRKEYAAVLRDTHGSLDAFKKFILSSSNCPDVLALCFLSEVFERRLNLYVPWKTRVSTGSPT